MQDEEILVEKARRHDPEAFSQLYEAHFDRIYRYLVLKIGEEMEAEDLTQQVFLKALQSISSFTWKGVSFQAWLYRIAHNQAVDYLRKKGRRATAPLDEQMASKDPGPQELAEQRLDIGTLMEAARGLTKAQREVISLRFAAGLSVAEVARVMGRSEGAVKALQHSAVVSLRKAMA